ncbi:hypothetical protein DPMN_111828 [Dreissena polymorpha]|uniref:EGF-like domain-containing protein n=1 Tax=Dreissena polymorpha TaxID=45954 RepID=A0A9D4KFA3_DREPO|nr:hypothetical protein DPMN_111828 [Dreissena polymorpha]
MLTHVIVSTFILASAFASFVPNSCLNGGTYIADTKTKGVVCKCAPGWDGPNCSTPFLYLGCYEDKTGIMNVRYPDSTSNSPLECASRCRDYTFVGVQVSK